MHITANTLELSHSNKEIRKAGIFAAFLCVLILMSLLVVFNNAPRIILGTEMNTNGLVEYLCLGKGCENLQSMDW